MLQEKINSDIKQAMKDKEADKLSVLRMLVSAFNNEAIVLKKKEQGLSEEEELKILKREVKKRKDAITQYQTGNRNDLVQKEKQELEILQTYLPAAMSEEEVRRVVEEVITGMGEVASAQFGQVMGQVMSKLKGQADGEMVSKIVREVIK